MAVTTLLPRSRRLYRLILAGYAASGRPPSPADLKRALDVDDAELDRALTELVTTDRICVDPHAAIKYAYPFSTEPTPYRVVLTDGRVLYAMCSIDALGLSAMLGRPVVVAADEPGTGHEIRIEVDGDVATWRPTTAVVYYGATGDEHTPSAVHSCPYKPFFTTAEAAEAWARSHPEISGRILGQGEALARGVQVFGTLLSDMLGGDGVDG